MALPGDESEAQAKRRGESLFGASQGESPEAWVTSNPGTSWEKTASVLDSNFDMRPGGYREQGIDQRNYMYGRDPNAANAAVNKAWGAGDTAMGYGQQGVDLGNYAYGVGGNLLNQRTGDAAYFNNRGVQQGDFGAQNQSLGALGGLEATQGPSAAQAQLQSGTNQAMAGQLALARSGRGLGGNAAAMGQAQGNMAGIQAGQATAASQLRAQEDAAWRQRQASNLTNVAGMQGQQSQANLGAAVQGRSQNDAMTQGMLGMGQDAYFQGVGAGMQGYGVGQQGAQTSIAGQGVANDIRGQEMGGGATFEDNQLRQWAAKNNLQLAGQQRQDQKEAGYLAAFGSLLGSV